jgi:uncharacterized lipoprotein YddW (UPF0748 family)
MFKPLVNKLFTAWSQFKLLFWGRRLACHWFMPTRKNRILLAFLAAFSLIISLLLTPVSAQTGLSDIQGHWAQPCIEELTGRQIISGYPDGSFKPGAPVTRAEFASMISKAFPDAPKVRNPATFVDVPSNYWAADEIRMANQAGFLSGYLGQIFNPVRKVTREQVLVALASGLKYTPSQPAEETLDAVFADAQEIPNYARNAIAAATEKQLVVNYPDVRTLNPNQLASRGEVAAFFCQAMEISSTVPNQYIAKIGAPTAPAVEAASPTTPIAPAVEAVTPTTPIAPAVEAVTPTTPIAPAVEVVTPTTPIAPAVEVVTPTTPIAPAVEVVTPTAPPAPAAPEVKHQTLTTPTAPTTSAAAPIIPTTPVIPTSEIRGVWLTNIDSDVLFSPSRLRRAIERLHQLNLNTLYPTVWNWGYTLYPSAVARGTIGRSLDPEPGLRGRDMLKEIIDQGHQKGMTVIPWFEFGFMAPADSELAKRYPNWILQRSDGTQIWKEGRHDRVWLNPFNPEVQQFIEDLIIEIVTKYDVDGIQFDDHFGFPSELGYDPFTVALYQQEHGGQSPPVDFKDPEWIRWRADKITAYMQRVYRGIKARKPNVLVSISPNPQKFSYEAYLADWETWDRQGLMDELILQVYRDDINRFIGELEQPEVQTAKQRIPVGIGIMTGVKPRFVQIPQIQAQVQTVRDRNFAGVSFFFYESLWTLTQERSAERQGAIANLFPAPVKRPDMLQR